MCANIKINSIYFYFIFHLIVHRVFSLLLVSASHLLVVCATCEDCACCSIFFSFFFWSLLWPFRSFFSLYSRFPLWLNRKKYSSHAPLSSNVLCAFFYLAKELRSMSIVCCILTLRLRERKKSGSENERITIISYL